MTLKRQQELLTETQRIIANGNDQIAKLDPGLTAEARSERIKQIREATLELMAVTRGEINKLRADSRGVVGQFSQAAARRRAKYHDDPAVDAQMRMSVISTLTLTNTMELLEHLQDAVREKNLAKAEAIRLEYQSRTDRNDVSNARFTTMFEDVVDEHAKEAETLHRQIDGIGQYSEALIHEFARGESNPAARLTAARAAGLSKPQEAA